MVAVATATKVHHHPMRKAVEDKTAGDEKGAKFAAHMRKLGHQKTKYSKNLKKNKVNAHPMRKTVEMAAARPVANMPVTMKAHASKPVVHKRKLEHHSAAKPQAHKPHTVHHQHPMRKAKEVNKVAKAIPSSTTKKTTNSHQKDRKLTKPATHGKTLKKHLENKRHYLRHPMRKALAKKDLKAKKAELEAKRAENKRKLEELKNKRHLTKKNIQFKNKELRGAAKDLKQKKLKQLRGMQRATITQVKKAHA